MEVITLTNDNQATTISLKEKINLAARNWTKPTKPQKGKISKFEEHLDTIRYLRSCRHMTYTQIHEFFNKNGLECTYQGLMQYVRKKNIGDIRSKNKRNIIQFS